MSFLRNLFCPNPKPIEHIFVSQNDFETNPMFYMKHVRNVRNTKYFRVYNCIDDNNKNYWDIIIDKTQTHQYTMNIETYIDMLNKYLGRPFVFTLLPNLQCQLAYVHCIKNNLDSNYTLLSDIISNELPH
jgi:hypothetical protein